jgi:hypothetical protein
MTMGAGRGRKRRLWRASDGNETNSRFVLGAVRTRHPRYAHYVEILRLRAPDGTAFRLYLVEEYTRLRSRTSTRGIPFTLIAHSRWRPLVSCSYLRNVQWRGSSKSATTKCSTSILYPVAVPLHDRLKPVWVRLHFLLNEPAGQLRDVVQLVARELVVSAWARSDARGCRSGVGTAPRWLRVACRV